MIFISFGSPESCLRVAVDRRHFLFLVRHAFLKKGVLLSKTINIHDDLVNICKYLLLIPSWTLPIAYRLPLMPIC